MIHDVRIIPIDGRPHVPSSVRLWFGDSRGHWEGNTLVVDTTNFNGKTRYAFFYHGLTDENYPSALRVPIQIRFCIDSPLTIRLFIRATSAGN